MSETINRQFGFEKYNQAEQEQIEKSKAWQSAIGLQAVDGLQVSTYLLDTAKEHIEGKINIDEVLKRIENYHEQRMDYTEADETKEADVVSSRIVKLLGEKTFKFSSSEWLDIHRRLFEGVLRYAGQIRKYNITKEEWVLNGDTVIYSSWNRIRDTLEYDFTTEKHFLYEGLSAAAAVRHLARFASNIWQNHPFCEGNTRATAVFMIKYMKSLGFRVKIDVFAENSRYFRNALVRANYSGLQNGIHATTKFLEMFFSNLLLGTSYELENRYLHVDYAAEAVEKDSRSAEGENAKCKNYILECTLEEVAVLQLMEENLSITQKTLAEKLGRSERTIKNIISSLQEKEYICRENGKKISLKGK